MKKVLVTALAVISLLQLQAQEYQHADGKAIELTLEQALEIALDESPNIKLANLEIEKQNYVRKEAWGNIYPSLSVSGQYTNSIVGQTYSKSLEFNTDFTNVISGTATLSLPLIVPAAYANIKMTRYQMENAVESARSSKISLVNEVTKAYHGILLTQQSLEVLTASEKLAQEVVDNSKILFENELGSEYNYLSAQVQLSNIKPNILSVRNALEINKMLLKMLIGIPQEYDVTLTGDLEYYCEMLTAEELELTEDISNNSELRTLNIQEKMLNQQLKLINTQRMPVLAAFGSLSITGDDAGRPSNSASPYLYLDPTVVANIYTAAGVAVPTPPTFNSGFHWQNPVAVGVQLSIPIFSGFKTNNQAKQVKNSIQQFKVQKELMTENLTVQIKSAISNLVTAYEKIDSNEKSVILSQKAYDITKSRYDSSMGTILELNSAENTLTQAKLSYAQAIYDFLAAKADYDKAVGTAF